jgi:DNA repair protein RadC
LLSSQRVERLVVVVLDGRLAVRRTETVAQGAVDRTPLPVREVLALVLRHDGRAFALAHNHPGGTPEPSEADVASTALLSTAAAQVGLRLVDHLVVAGARWTSVT